MLKPVNLHIPKFISQTSAYGCHKVWGREGLPYPCPQIEKKKTSLKKRQFALHRYLLTAEGPQFQWTNNGILATFIQTIQRPFLGRKYSKKGFYM